MDGMPQGLKIKNETGLFLHDASKIAGVNYVEDTDDDDTESAQSETESDTESDDDIDNNGNNSEILMKPLSVLI